MFSRSKAWALALLVAAFVAGGAAGWGGRSMTAARRPPPFRYRDASAMVAYLKKELSLSPAQQDSVRAVLQRHRPDLDAIWKQVRPRVDSIRSAIQTEISAQLAAAQQSRYRDLVARFERQRRGADSARTGRK